MKRLRFSVLCVLVLATASAFSLPAPAGSAAAAAQAGPRGFGGPSQIPWATVGSGWVLTQWATARDARTDYLVLTDQTGHRYLVTKQAGILLDWSGDGQRALLDTETNSGRTTILVVDLRTGAIAHRFVVPTSKNDAFQSAGFTRPDGLAVVVATYTTHQVLTRYSLSGQALVTYPASFASVGAYDGSWAYRPDGAELALGTAHGVAIVANDGAVLSELHLAGSSSCQVKKWWTATVALASCATGRHTEQRLFLFDTAGGATRALTRNNVSPDFGDLSAWHVGPQVYVNVSSACGYVYLARLVGAAPIMVKVPGVPAGASIHVVGASSSALALIASIACHGGASLIWYTPSTHSSRVVLGPPVTGGYVGESLAYPTRYG